ncbi:MAG: colanic acid biosynthesis glycosyltransferase WcaL [Synechococcaceae cyanobacterium SM2_3_1]|nr:colanic acid biosynthesis glycosyltransferase WcaL [Synechococcaceae cyanobacterium SM2_3_1]
MRVAHVVDRFPQLSETFILNMITGLIDRGHDIDIIPIRSQPLNNLTIHQDVFTYRLLDYTRQPISIPENPTYRLIKVFYHALSQLLRTSTPRSHVLRLIHLGRKSGSIEVLIRAIPLLELDKHDIVHCHFGPLALTTLKFREIGLLQGKLITAFHGFDMTLYPQDHGWQCYQPLFAEGNLFLPISHHWQGKLISLGCPSHKTSVHRMGINCDHFQYRPRDLKVNEPVILASVCRLVEKKGIEYGIRAVAQLVNQWPNLQYWIIGDGTLRPQLEALVNQLQLTAQIHFWGWKKQEEIITLLYQAHILMAPSVTSIDGDQEGIPVALMEAMAMGLPVVSTLHSGIPELVEDGVSGFLVPERDSDALADRLHQLLTQPKSWMDMGWSGRRRVMQDYNIKSLNDQLEAIYQEVSQDTPTIMARVN